MQTTGMELTWSCGIAHDDLFEQTREQHLLRLRPGYGRGLERTDGGRLRPVSWVAGTLEYLPPGMAYGHASRVASDWIVLALPASAWQALHGPRAARRDPVLCGQGRRYGNAQQALRQVARLMRAAPDSQGPPAQETMAAMAVDWSRALWGGGSQGEDDAAWASRRPGRLDGPVLARMLQYIEDGLAGPLTLENMAQEAGLSVFHFVASFRRATGLTPHQYVLARRIARARRALERGERSIVRIAMDCGFSSHAHLTTAFGARLGIRPSEYRGLFPAGRGAGAPPWRMARSLGVPLAGTPVASCIAFLSA